MTAKNPADYGLVQTKHLPSDLLLPTPGTSYGVPQKELDAARPSPFHDIMYIEEHATYWYVMWRSNRYAAGNKPD